MLSNYDSMTIFKHRIFRICLNFFNQTKKKIKNKNKKNNQHESVNQLCTDRTMTSVIALIY